METKAEDNVIAASLLLQAVKLLRGDPSKKETINALPMIANTLIKEVAQ